MAEFLSPGGLLPWEQGMLGAWAGAGEQVPSCDLSLAKAPWEVGL